MLRFYRLLSIGIALGAAVFATAALAPSAASAAVDWGPQRTLSDWAWSGGSSLAVTGTGSSLAVHQLFSTDFVDGSFATDHGPYEGVFLTTSDDRGQSWSAPTRVSQSKRQADRGALAADGSHLYAVWVTQTSYDHYDPSAHRVLYLRANDSAGAPNAWGPTIRLSKQKGRVDRASVAASDGRVYVVWTDSETGDIRLAVSADGGRSWKRSVIGKAKGSDPGGEGRSGLPSVAAAGPNVGVTWLATQGGAVKARLSTNGGRSWHPAASLAPSGGGADGGSPDAAGSGGRLAFAWSTPAGVWVRTWQGGAWSTTARVAPFGGAAPYSGGYDVAVALTGADSVGVAWSACRSATCDTLSALTRTHELWSQSADGGSTWSDPDVIRASQAADQPINDGASAVWLDPSTRLVSYAGYIAGLTTYRLYARVGSGAG